MRTIDLLKNLIEKSPNWTQNKVGNEIGVSSQNMSNRMNLKGAPKTDFVAKVLDALGYRLVVVPKGANLPQGSIVIDPCAEDACAEGDKPADAPKNPMKPANWTEPDGAATHRRDWTDKYYGGGE